VLIAHEFRGAGIPAHAFTGAEAGIVTNDTAGNASIVSICPAALINAAKKGITPVVCGFQGISESGHTTTLGRGGSDTTACALGVALDAQAIEIYSDVDGVMTADPRTVKEARVINILAADELFQLCRMGSRIVHTPAAELALESGVALLVKNTFSDHPGTKVCDIAAYHNTKTATAVTCLSDLVRFKVDLKAQEGELAHVANQAAVYDRIAQAGVSLDMFTPSDTHLYFMVPAHEAPTVRALLENMDYQCTEGFAKVTVVGAGMHGQPGVMAQVAQALTDAHIDIKQTADSHTTISVLIRQTHAEQAQEVLHRAFELSLSAVPDSDPRSREAVSSAKADKD